MPNLMLRHQSMLNVGELKPSIIDGKTRNSEDLIYSRFHTRMADDVAIPLM